MSLLVSVFFGAGTCILRRDLLYAVDAYHRTPTAALKAEIERQKWLTKLDQVKLGATAFAFMTAIGLPSWLIVCRWWSDGDRQA